MSTAINSITVTSILSVVLHGTAVAGLLVLFGQSVPDNAVGQGIEIELVSSVKVSNQHESNQTEADVSRKQEYEAQAIAKNTSAKKTISKNQDEKKQDEKKHMGNMPVLALVSTAKDLMVRNSVFHHNNNDEQHEQKQQRRTISETVFKDDSVTTVAQSTAASQQQHSILELLHSRIADNKKYPYLAKRQRREGVTTVAFVLHPSGMIEGMRLINSSQTTALDRAALSAVKRIEPFIPAQDYLKQAETFKVDVVFKLL